VTSTEPILEVEELTRQFGSLTAVDEVSMAVPTGEIHAVIGPNGAGKTTLFDMIAGSVDPSSGRVWFRDEDLTGTTEDERARRGIVRAFQITQLFLGLPVLENLRLAAQSRAQEFNPFGRKDKSLVERAEAMYERLNFDAGLSVKAGTLSHGDKKKLEIGMSLITDPSLLLLDEPTSGVSEAESQQIIELINNVKNAAVLLIEHDIDVILGHSDRVTVLHRGEMIANGPPSEITQNEDVQRAYLGGES